MGSLRDRLTLSDSPESQKVANRTLNNVTGGLVAEGWNVKSVLPRILEKNGIEITVEITGKDAQ